MSGAFPRNPVVKANGIKWNTRKSDFGEVQSDIDHISEPAGTRQNTTLLVWMTPEQIREKQIALHGSELGYERKNQRTEHKKVKQLKHRMVRGDVFNPLSFYHDRFGNVQEPQEGAHRTHAITELGVKKAPVWLHFQKGNIEHKIMTHYPATEAKISRYKSYAIGEKPGDIGDFGKRKVKKRMSNKFYGI